MLTPVWEGIQPRQVEEDGVRYTEYERPCDCGGTVAVRFVLNDNQPGLEFKIKHDSANGCVHYMEQGAFPPAMTFPAPPREIVLAASGQLAREAHRRNDELEVYRLDGGPDKHVWVI